MKGKTTKKVKKVVFDPKTMTVEELANIWLTTYKEPKLRPSSYELIKKNTELHVLDHIGHLLVTDVTPIHIQMVMNELVDYSDSMQAKVLIILRNLFTVALDNGIIEKSPVPAKLRPSGNRTQEEEPLTREQTKTLLEAVKGTRAYTFCFIALSTGLRRGELLGLMWSDIESIDGVMKFINVRHNKAFPGSCNDAPVTEMLKTEAGRRRIPISPQLADYLKKLKKNSDSEFVIAMDDGRSYSLSAFRRMWELVTNSVDFSVHAHQLRHTFLTRMFEAGADVKEVQYLAGHSTPTVTMKIYVHYDRKSRESQTASKVALAMAGLC